MKLVDKLLVVGLWSTVALGAIAQGIDLWWWLRR
jgi:hypothetical protein